MKIAVPFAKNVASLGIIAATSALDAGIQKKKTCFWKYNFNSFK